MLHTIARNLQTSIIIIIIIIIISKKTRSAVLHRLVNNASTFKYEDNLDKLNFLPVHVRRRQLDAVVLIIAFKGNTACPSKLAGSVPQGPSGTSLHFCSP
jgi:hypothetical protein